MASLSTSERTGRIDLLRSFWAWLDQHLMVLVLGSFIVSLIVTRFIIIIRPEAQFWVVGLHLHHYYLGLICILVAVGIPLYYRVLKSPRFFAILFGTGMGILLDEAGLLLTQGQDYLAPYTYPIIFVFLCLFTGLSYLQSVSPLETRIPQPPTPKFSSRSPILRLPFIIAFISYVAWFGIARGFTTLFPSFQIYVGTIHIQHFYLGILFLISTGLIVFYYQKIKHETLIATLYGGGLGLIINQLAELLTESDYWHPLTYPFFLGFCLLFIIVIGFTIRKTKSHERRIPN